MKLVPECFLGHLRDDGADAAELRMSDRVLGAALREELAGVVPYAFGHDDDAVAVFLDRLFDLGEKLGLIEGDFGKQDDMGRVAGLLAGHSAGGRHPAGVATHDFEHEHLGGRPSHRHHIERGFAGGHGDVLGG